MATSTTYARPGLETWKNEGAATVFLRKLDRHGDLSEVVLVRGRGVVHLSEEERRLNQDLIVDAKYDWFKNGTFTPVRILPEAADADEIASNPNTLSEEDMRELVRTRGAVGDKRFSKRLAETTNPITLDRLREIAQAEDASISRMRAIEDRIGEVAPTGAMEVDGAPPPTAGDGLLTVKAARP